MNFLLLSLDDKQDFELCYQGLIAADDIIRNLGNENIILIEVIPLLLIFLHSWHIISVSSII